MQIHICNNSNAQFKCTALLNSKTEQFKYTIHANSNTRQFKYIAHTDSRLERIFTTKFLFIKIEAVVVIPIIHTDGEWAVANPRKEALPQARGNIVVLTRVPMPTVVGPREEKALPMSDLLCGNRR